MKITIEIELNDDAQESLLNIFGPPDQDPDVVDVTDAEWLEWCTRRLLGKYHENGRKRLRKPVTPIGGKTSDHHREEVAEARKKREDRRVVEQKKIDEKREADKAADAKRRAEADDD